MKIFVTGASGYVGQAVATAMRRAGHQVLGLVRTEEKANRLWIEEVRPVLGDLRKPESFAAAAAASDVLVHCASDVSPDRAKVDRDAVESLLQAARVAQLPRMVLYTSGCWVYGSTLGTRAHEGSALAPPAIVAWRPEIEAHVLRATSERVGTVVLRPGCVYGGRGGLTGAWFESADKDGAARIVGDGQNRWATVHVQDLADAYVRVVERRVKGEVFNVTDRSRFTVREMASAAAQAAGKGGEVRAWPMQEAAQRLGAPFAEALALDQHVDAWKVATLLGWTPRFGGFADDAAAFYAAWKHQKP